MICKKCGCEVIEPRYTEDDYRYCPFCGYKLDIGIKGGKNGKDR